MDAICLPAEMRALSGRIADLDSHEMMPAQVWASELGPEFAEVAEAYLTAGADSIQDPDYPGDVMPVTEEIPAVKGPGRPAPPIPRVA